MKLTRAVHANEGVMSWYLAKLRRGIRGLTVTITRVLNRTDTPAEAMSAIDLFEPDDTFDLVAPELAERYVSRASITAERSLQSSLVDAGITIKFEPSERMRSVALAAVEENVALIRSIPTEHVARVQQAVQQAYLKGGKMSEVYKAVREIDGMTHRRAETIARDQTNKITAISTRERRLELGLTKAVWLHSHAGKHPRPDHLAANGREYDIAQGCLIGGEYIQPGELINCRCSSRIVLPTYATIAP